MQKQKMKKIKIETHQAAQKSNPSVLLWASVKEFSKSDRTKDRRWSNSINAYQTQLKKTKSWSEMPIK